MRRIARLGAVFGLVAWAAFQALAFGPTPDPQGAPEKKPVQGYTRTDPRTGRAVPVRPYTRRPRSRRPVQVRPHERSGHPIQGYERRRPSPSSPEPKGGHEARPHG